MALVGPTTQPFISTVPGKSRRFAVKKLAPEQDPRLSVVIVNYCQWEETAALVRRLSKANGTREGLVEVVIVDNHSPSHPLAGWLRRRPEVSLRRWNRNRGFARAVNEGRRLSRGQWLLLLNPDISVSDNFLDSVVNLADRLAHEEPLAGVVGFQLRNSDGSRQWSSGFLPTLPRLLAGLAMPRSRRKYRPLRTRRRCRVPWVTGCCLLLRRDCLGALGGFDENFFLYYEDVDLCRRATAHGWKVLYEPGIRAVHLRPLHVRCVPAHVRLFARHAVLTYGAKHWPQWQLQLLAKIVQGEAWVRRLWAKWRGDPLASNHLKEMGAMARDFAHGRITVARRRLERVARQEEANRASQAINRHS